MRRLLALIGLFLTLAAPAHALTSGQRILLLTNQRVSQSILLTSINGPTLPTTSAFDTTGSNGVQGDGDGFTGAYIGAVPTPAPYTSPITFKAARQGFAWNGSAIVATTYNDTRTITAWARKPYSSLGPPTGSSYTPPLVIARTARTMVFDDYVYSTDTVSGVTNNSSVTSPVPICQWTIPDRKVVGNSLYIEASCFHRDARNGQEIAGVTYTATDNAGATAACVSHTESVSSSADTGFSDPSGVAVIVYKCTLNLTGLATGYITLDAVACPWIGTSASCTNTTNVTVQSPSGSIRRQFSSRYFWHDAAFAPPIAYVDAASGNDSTCTWGTVDATVFAATHCASIKGALGKLLGAGITTSFGLNKPDGAIIYVMNTAGSDLFASPTVNMGTPETLATITIKGCNALHVACAASPTVIGNSAASYGLKMGPGTVLTGPWPIPTVTEPQIDLVGVNFDRGVGFQFNSTQTNTPAAVSFQNIPNFNLEALTNNILAASATSPMSATFYGVTFTNFSTSGADSNFAPSNGEYRIFRGIDALVANDTTTWEAFAIIGGKWGKYGAFTGKTGRTDSGGIIAFIQARNASASLTGFSFGGTVTANGPVLGFAFVQNLLEITNGETHLPAMLFSGDLATESFDHMILHHNTVDGSNGLGVGRLNWCMDNAAGSGGPGRIYCKRSSMVGNIWGSDNTKSDLYCSSGGGCTASDAPFRTQTWADYYGVGRKGNMTQYAGTACGNFATFDNKPIFAGMNANNADNMGCGLVTHGYSTGGQLDPKFTTDGGAYWDGGCTFNGTTSGTALTINSGLTCATGSGTAASVHVGSHITGGVIGFNVYVVTVTDPTHFVLNQSAGTNTGVTLTAAGTNGPGSSDVHLQGGSPACAVIRSAVLSFDLDGNARPATNDAAGVYKCFLLMAAARRRKPANDNAQPQRKSA